MSLHSTTDRFIEDIVKAAKESFARSPRRQPGEELHIQVSGSSGHKLANHAALGAGLGGVLLPGLGAPIGAAFGADEGQGLSAAGGTLVGGLGGGLAGRLVGNALGGAQGRLIGSGLGAAAGALYGANRGGERTASAIDEAYTAGIKTAAARFGIKEAIFPALAQKALAAMGQLGHGIQTGAQHIAPNLPDGLRKNLVSGIGQFGAGMHNAAPQILQGFKGAENKEAFIGPLLGSIAGPALARSGVGALARGAGGGALGSMAGKVLPRIGGGMGGMAFDAATSMAGGALGDKLQQPRAPGL